VRAGEKFSAHDSTKTGQALPEVMTMTAHEAWTLFSKTGTPALYLLYRALLRAERCPAGEESRSA
jgi:hypothetical protein